MISLIRKIFMRNSYGKDLRSNQIMLKNQELFGESAGGTITWLHLSDLHFQAEGVSRWDSDIVINALLQDLQDLKHKFSLSPDAIFVSGDITYSGKAEEYEISKAFFDNLLNITNLENGIKLHLSKQSMHFIHFSRSIRATVYFSHVMASAGQLLKQKPHYLH